MLHFYRWTSPPGVMKILCIIIIILCVAMFACVASTLAWDYDASAMGLGVLGWAVEAAMAVDRTVVDRTAVGLVEVTVGVSEAMEAARTWTPNQARASS